MLKYTRRPWRNEFLADADSRCVLPLPGFPNASTFSRRSTNVPSSSAFDLPRHFGRQPLQVEAVQSLLQRQPRIPQQPLHPIRRAAPGTPARPGPAGTARSSASPARPVAPVPRSSGGSRADAVPSDTRCSSFFTSRRLAHGITSVALAPAVVEAGQIHLRDRRLRSAAAADLLTQHEPYGLHASSLPSPISPASSSCRSASSTRASLSRAARYRISRYACWPARAPCSLQRVVGHAEPAGGEQVLAVAVVLERAGLAHQPVDDVPVVDPMLAPAPQPRQSLRPAAGVPDLEVSRRYSRASTCSPISRL